MSLPALIRNARKARGWSQERLGRLTSNSRDTIWRFEKGSDIESSRVERILAALGLLQRLRELEAPADERADDRRVMAWRLAYAESPEMQKVLDSIAAPYLAEAEMAGASGVPGRMPARTLDARQSTVNRRGRKKAGQRTRDDRP